MATEGFTGRSAVGSDGVDAGGQLVLEGRHTHLEELVEVGREDRAELGPLEQRDARFGDQGEDAGVELEPAQLAVDEAGTDGVIVPK
jgi:hypothetical protein